MINKIYQPLTDLKRVYRDEAQSRNKQKYDAMKLKKYLNNIEQQRLHND